MTPRREEDAPPRTPSGVAGAIVAGAFGLIYAYDLFEAILNLVGVVTQLNAYNVFAAQNGLDAASIPWTLLVVTIALPPVAFALAVLLGRHQGLGMRALLFAGGLAVVAAATLSLTALA